VSPGVLLLATHSGTLILLGVRAASRLHADPTHVLILGLALAWFFIYGAYEALSLFAASGELPAHAILALLLALLLNAATGEAQRARLGAWKEIGLLAVSLAPLGIANAVLGFGFRVQNYDALTYHLPRAVFFLSQGSFDHFPTSNARQTFFPVAWTALHMYVFQYTGQDRLVVVPNLIAWWVAALVVYAVSRELGARRLTAWLATAGMASCPLVLGQGYEVQNDLPAGATLAGAILFLVAWLRERRFRNGLSMAFLLGLGLGVKWTLLFYWPLAVPVAYLLVRELIRRSRETRAWLPQLAGAAVLTAILAAPPFLRNIAAARVPMASFSSFDYRGTDSREYLRTIGGHLAQLVFLPFVNCPFRPSHQRGQAILRWLTEAGFPIDSYEGRFRFGFSYSPRAHNMVGLYIPLVFLPSSIAALLAFREPAMSRWLACSFWAWHLALSTRIVWYEANVRYYVVPIIVGAPVVAVIAHRFFQAVGRPLTLIASLSLGAVFFAGAGWLCWHGVERGLRDLTRARGWPFVVEENVLRTLPRHDRVGFALHSEDFPLYPIMSTFGLDRRYVSFAGLAEAEGYDGIIVTDRLLPFQGQEARRASKKWIEVVVERPVAIGLPIGLDPTLPATVSGQR
jgi:hypothetical protein